MRDSSIRRRLLTAVLVTQVLLTVGLVFIAVVSTRRQLRTAFDAGLHGRAMSVAALVRYSEDVPPTLVFDKEMVPPPLDREHPDLYRILGSQGKVVALSPNWPAAFDPAPKRNREYWNILANGQPYRAVRLKDVPVLDREGPDTITGSKLTVLYAASTEELNEAMWRAGVMTGAASLLLLIVSTAVAVWAIRRGLSPIGVLAESAAKVSPLNWELNAPPESLHTTELAPLAQAMTIMLSKLQEAFKSQREFVANAAHELKTPVAILKSTLQSLLQRSRTSEEYHVGVEAALEDTTRLEKLVHSMLRLARVEQWAAGGQHRDIQKIDLTSTCEMSVAHLRKIAELRGIKLELARDGEPSLRADPEDMELVWDNLLENAIHYSPNGSTVAIAIRGDTDFAEVAVTDHGPGIASEQLERIFDRFHRADTSRARNTGGYGLGLAISKAIIEAYDGTIRAKSDVGHGTTMTVRLPLNS